MTPESLTILQVASLIKDTLQDLRDVTAEPTCPPQLLNEGVSRGEIEEQIFTFEWKSDDFGIFDEGEASLDAKVTPDERKIVIESLAELHLALDECLQIFESEKTDENDARKLRRSWRRIQGGLNLEVLYTLPTDKGYQVRGTLGQRLQVYSRNLDCLTEADLRRSSSSGPGSDGGSIVDPDEMR
ncbi:hypothetical protein BDV18DRAFT_158244 [Aspergillus unguis]